MQNFEVEFGYINRLSAFDCRDRRGSSRLYPGNGYQQHGLRLAAGFEPLIMRRKPYRDIPSSEDSETEEFNVNISLNRSTAYRTRQPNNRK